MLAPDPTVLHDLKAVSRAYHGSVEARADIRRSLHSAPLMRGLLSRFYGFYRPAEEILAPWLSAIPGLDFASRRKAGHLQRDLSHLGLTDGEVERLPLYAVDRPGSLSEALGYAYVLEGATLGGLMVRQLAEQAAPPMSDLRFFGCYGSETARLWYEFCAVIEDRCTSQADARAAVRGATAAYAGIGACLA